MTGDVASSAPRLAGRRVVLRALTPADATARRLLGRHPDIVRAFGGTPTAEAAQPMTEVEAQEWYRRESAWTGAVCWAIEHGGRFIGTARLTIESEADRRARYSVGILDPSLLGHGLGTEVTHLVLAHAFGALGLHRVSLRVLAANRRARRCYLGCGFVEEGIERESALVDDRWQDDVMMAVLEPEHRGRDR